MPKYYKSRGICFAFSELTAIIKFNNYFFNHLKNTCLIRFSHCQLTVLLTLNLKTLHSFENSVMTSRTSQQARRLESLSEHVRKL